MTLIWLERFAENVGAGKPVLTRASCAPRCTLFLAPLDLLADLARHGALLELGDVLPERVLEVLGCLDDLRGSRGPSWAGTSPAGRGCCSRRRSCASSETADSIDWPLLVTSIFPARSSASDEQPNRVELPAVRLLGELVGERAPARHLAVARPVLDPRKHLGERAALGVEDGLPVLDRTRCELGEDRREPLEVLARSVSDVQVLLRHARGRLFESVEDIREGLRENLRRRRARRRSRTASGLRSLPRKKTVPARSACAEQPAELVLVPPLPPLLLGDERRLVLRLRAALLAAEDLLRAVELDRLAVDRLVERGDPEDGALAPPGSGAAPPRRRRRARSGSASVRWTSMSPVDDLAAVEVEARLERLDVEEACATAAAARAPRPSRREPRATSPGFGAIPARCRSQSSSAGDGMR